MSYKSYYVRNMLQKYGKQLVNARRLARFKRSLRASDAEDELTISREAKRNELIEKVAREIIENLIIAGSDNPLVSDIKARLAEDTGEELQFTYPPSEDDLQIFRKTEVGPIEITANEKIRVLNRLWQITLDKVNDTML